MAAEHLTQNSIRSTPLSRMAELAGTGARVGLNYLKYYGQRAVSPESASKTLRDDLKLLNVGEQGLHILGIQNRSWGCRHASSVFF